MAKENL